MAIHLLKLCAAAAALLIGGVSPAMAQSAYPERSVRILVGFSAGGSADLVARMLAEELRVKWGRPVMVENRVGAGGAIAADHVAKAAPDGHTLLVTTASHTALGALMDNLPYDSYRDFTPINLVASAPNVLVTRADSPLKTLPEYLEAAKARPGEISYATSAVGGILHFAGEQFAHGAGIKLNHIPYKGANDVVLAVLSGTVQSSWSVASAAIPLVAPDKLHIVAVASEERSSLIPDVPTFNELGMPGMTSETWFGVLAPPNLPEDVKNTLNDTLEELLQREDVRQKLVALGAEPRGAGPDEFAATIRDELEQFSSIAEAAGIKP